MDERAYDLADCAVFRKTADEFGGLSNMAPGFPLAVSGVAIRTSEALYQCLRFPHRPEVQQLVIDQASPMTAKMKSRRYRSESRTDWERVRIMAMRWCLHVKLAQHWDSFGRLLESTGDVPIVEHSRRDGFWGAKLSPGGKLVGINVLGRLLMELREGMRSADWVGLRTVPPPSLPNARLLGKPIGHLTSVPAEGEGKLESVSAAPTSAAALVQLSLWEESLGDPEGRAS